MLRVGIQMAMRWIKAVASPTPCQREMRFAGDSARNWIAPSRRTPIMLGGVVQDIDPVGVADS
jgi:hypothetical protein